MTDSTPRAASDITLARCQSRGRINLRGNCADPAFLAGIVDTIGVEPPPTANTSRSGGEGVILWLGPNEWLIEVATATETDIAAALEDALSGLHASVVVVGDGHVTLSLSGPRSVDVLAKGMTLNLDPDCFPAGSCARSVLAKAPVLLYRPGDALVYEVTVARSFSEYAFRWLEDAALEYLQPA